MLVQPLPHEVKPQGLDIVLVCLVGDGRSVGCVDVGQARFPAIMKDEVADLVGRLLLNQNGRSLNMADGSLSPC